MLQCALRLRAYLETGLVRNSNERKSYPKENNHMLKKFLKDETGAELAEYAVGVALLVAIGIVVYKVLGNAVNDSNSISGSKIKTATYP
jgi:Flp pilus assembly pilin Flp